MAYRAINFRDGVLWPVARKKGLDPTKDFKQDDSYLIVDSINSWLRKTWDSADFPEWTITDPRTPDPVTHLVDISGGTNTGVKDTRIKRVLDVYLSDPQATPGPIDTPFKLRDDGLFCGFEHGTQVWIKYIPPSPVFTARKWNTNDTYNAGDEVYSTRSGECYISLNNQNTGHDPTGPNAAPAALATEVTQVFEPGTPAVPSRAGIWEVSVGFPPWWNTIDKLYVINFLDADGAPHSVSYTTPVDGGTLTDLINGLIAEITASSDPWVAALTATISAGGGGGGTSKLRISLSTEAFSISSAITSLGVGPVVSIATMQVQSYLPSVPATDPIPQRVTIFLDGGQGTTISLTYTIKLTDAGGVDHIVTYTSGINEFLPTTLAGITDAIAAAAEADQFWGNVVVNIDTATLQLELVINQYANVDVHYILATIAFWKLIPFPLMLVDPVIRGAYADYLREEGQTDKAIAEEQAVLTDQGMVVSKVAHLDTVLTDQIKERSRYG